MELVTIGTFDNPLEANLLKLQLESFDIPAVLKDEQMVGLMPIYNITVGGIKVQVRSTDYDKAASLLKELKVTVSSIVQFPFREELKYA
jgi:hypothetical protein